MFDNNNREIIDYNVEDNKDFIGKWCAQKHFFIFQYNLVFHRNFIGISWEFHREFH